MMMVMVMRTLIAYLKRNQKKKNISTIHLFKTWNYLCRTAENKNHNKTNDDYNRRPTAVLYNR